MKSVISSLLLLSLQNCLYNLKHINRVDNSENKWTIEEKKPVKSK